MSPLAFDKQGKPFAWNSRTRKLKVRLFRNPSARGTCAQVFDGTGAPLYIDAEIDYAEFRRAISNVPGFYRLDQCDDDGVDIEGAPPAYVSIEHLRNNAQPVEGHATIEVSPLSIIQSMAAIQADVMKTMAAQQAQLLAATAEIMRAPYRPPMPTSPTLEHRNAAEDEEDDEEEGEDAEAKNEILGMIGPMLPTIAEKFGEQIGKRLMDAVTGMFAPKAPPDPAAPAATSVTHATPAPAAPYPHVVQAGVAAGQSAPADSEVDAPPAPVSSSATPSVAGAPTPAQMAHLFAIHQHLTPQERAHAERVIASMAPETRTTWIAALSTKSIEQSVADIRGALAKPEAGTP
jgi:hypothetical protein